MTTTRGRRAASLPGIALLVAAMLAVPTARASSPRPLRVVAATNDLAAIARAVGGDLLEIDVVARPDRDPHALEVRPGTMRKAAGADVYLEVGLSLDAWSDDIIRGSRNRDLRIVRCSDAVTPLEVPGGRVDASMGDVHPDGNPHYWLDPLNGAAIARFVAGVLAEEDPAHAATYRERAEAFAADVERRLPGWDARLRGAAFVEYHRVWSYLADRFGMEIVGRVEPLPGIPPAARDLANLAETIRARGETAVVREIYHSESAVDFLARESGARAVVLPSSCAEPTPESYLATFDRAAEVLGRPARTGRASAAGNAGRAPNDAGDAPE